MKIVIALVACLLLGGCATNASRVIQASSFQLVDDDGVVRAEIGIDGDNSAGLFIRDADGRKRVAVIHDESQSAVYLFDETEAIRIGVAQFAHGGGGVALHGPESKGAAVLYYKNDGSLSFYDADGNLMSRTPSS